MDSAEIRDRVNKLIVQMLGVEPERVTPDADFVSDLGVGDYDFTEMMFAADAEFSFEISQDEAEQVKTVDDLYRLVEDKLKVTVAA
jgi:acyl carrier protein